MTISIELRSIADALENAIGRYDRLKGMSDYGNAIMDDCGIDARITQLRTYADTEEAAETRRQIKKIWDCDVTLFSTRHLREIRAEIDALGSLRDCPTNDVIDDALAEIDAEIASRDAAATVVLLAAE